MNRDEKIKNGDIEIANKLATIEGQYNLLNERKVKTNCRLSFPDGNETYNIRTMTTDNLEYFKAKLMLYKQHLPETVKIAGFTVNDWIDDITLIIAKKSMSDEIIRLKTLQAKLTELYSESAKADIAVDEILKSL